MKTRTKGVQRYEVVACQEDGEHLAEMRDVDWRGVQSLTAAWTLQFRDGMDAGDGLKWDQNGYIQIHPIFK